MALTDELLTDLKTSEYSSQNSSQIDYHTSIPSASNKLLPRVADVIKFAQSKRLTRLMSKITSGDETHDVLVEASSASAYLDTELIAVHNVVRDLYSRRFPELESLLGGPSVAYSDVARELENDLTSYNLQQRLPRMLNSATVMVVTLAASTTRGRKLTKEENESLTEACEMAEYLASARKIISSYVEERMSRVAPELAALVGPTTAASLLGSSGGLQNLARTPACNVLLLGRKDENGKKCILSPGTVKGDESTIGGHVDNCPSVKAAPVHLRRKIARLVAAKAVLAARVDACRHPQEISKSVGEAGRCLLSQIERRLQQLTAPPPPKPPRALPCPEANGTGKKRGGRRARRQRGQLGITAARAKVNRIKFIDVLRDSDYCDGLLAGLWGMGAESGAESGLRNGGSLRAPPIDERTKVRISRALQRRLQVERETWGGITTVRRKLETAGTASSIAFTTLQGLEIVHPQASLNASDTGSKYFKTNIRKL